MTISNTWHPASWRDYTALQQPNYPDQSALLSIQMELGKLPPLVTSYENNEKKNNKRKTNKNWMEEETKIEKRKT